MLVGVGSEEAGTCHNAHKQTTSSPKLSVFERPPEEPQCLWISPAAIYLPVTSAWRYGQLPSQAASSPQGSPAQTGRPHNKQTNEFWRPENGHKSFSAETACGSLELTGIISQPGGLNFIVLPATTAKGEAANKQWPLELLC